MEHFLPLEILHSACDVAEQAEVFCLFHRGTPVHFEANNLKQVETKESNNIALRIFREGKIGFATASGPCSYSPTGGEGMNKAETLLNMAVETSQFGLPANFTFSSLKEYPQVSIFDPQVEKTTMEEMIELGTELIDRVRSYAPDVLCDVGLVKGSSSVYIINSQGGEATYDKSFFGLALECVLIQDTDMLFVGDSESSCRLPPSVDVLVDSIIRQLDLAKTRATVSSGSLPVIFTPRGVASALLSPIASAFNGKTVLEGASRLRDRLGEQVFDRRLNLWDDATLAYCEESCPCDDEGVSSQRLPLIANGTVSKFLYDLQTAALAGTTSTGSGRRVGSSFPKPSVSSLVIGGGNVSFTEMVEDMKHGLIVEQLIGADQGNLLAGDFGGNVLLGYKVENGKIVGRVKDTMISGNMYEVLKELPGIGCEVRWVDGILQTPALYCNHVSVAAKE